MNAVLTSSLCGLGYRSSVRQALKTTKLSAPISVYFSPNYTETQSGFLLTLAVLAVALVIGKAFAFEFGSVLAGR